MNTTEGELAGDKPRSRAAITKLRGLCVGCGTRPPEPGRTHCAKCLETVKALRRSRKLRGLCTACGKPAKPGRSHCEECLRRATARNKVKAQQSAEAGLCVRCHKNEKAAGRRFCVSCLQAQSVKASLRAKQHRQRKARKKAYDRARSKLRYKSRKDAGICSSCGQQPAVKGRVKCQDCLDQHESYALRFRQQQIKAGMCPMCGVRKPAEGRHYCSHCLKMAAQSNRRYFARRKTTA
jgi:hypothetical protein